MDIDRSAPGRKIPLMNIDQVPLKLPSAASSRTFVVGMALVPLVLLVSATVPAMIFIAFMPKGMSRIAVYAKTLIVWTEAILVNSESVAEYARKG